MNKIYIYSTKTYINKRWFKIGQTEQEDASIRVKQQDGTSNPERLDHIVTYEVSSKVTDKKIHALLDKRGYKRTRDDADREWFDLRTRSKRKACRAISTIINEIECGVARPNSFAMRQEQKECRNKAVEAFTIKKLKEFLIDAKMRFGKSLCAAFIAKSLKAKRVLILTGKPQVRDEWRETFDEHVAFDGWKFYSSDEFDKNNPITLKFKGYEVLFASLQDADLSKEKWKFAKKYHFDLLIIDEQHYAGDTERTLKLLDTLSYTRILELSGTPFKALLSGRYHDENSYKWSYIDEQRKKREEEMGGWQTTIYRDLPTMRIRRIEVSDAVKQTVSLYSKEEGFSLTKMFASDDGVTFNDEGSVKLFLDGFFGIGVHKTESPIRTCAPDHLFMLLQFVNSVHAMVNLINKHSDLYHGYKAIAATQGGVKDIRDIHRAIRFNPKTITVSCGRFNTGVTVREWDMIAMLADGEAATTYFQSIFRVQSADPNRRNSDGSPQKQFCDVVDYNPQRAIEAIYEYCHHVTKKGDNVQKTVREFLDFCPVLDHADNKISRVDTDTVLNFIAESGGFIEQFGKSCMFNWDVLKDHLDQVTLLSKIDGKSGVTVRKQINDNELLKGKNFVNLLHGLAKDKADKKVIDKLKQNAITLMKKLPNYIYVDRKQPIESYEDIVRINHNDIFEDATGITIDQFSGLVETGFIEKDHLNRCIMAFRQSLS